MNIYILISNIISIFTQLFFFALIIRIILSWIKISPYNPISRIAIIGMQILEIIANRILMFFAN